jgi:molybdenum cofactor cytidylyltransferase
MGSSLRAAAHWLEQQSSIRACVIGLADMPLIKSETVCAIRDLVALHDEPVVACSETKGQTKTQLGFPRALPRKYFAQLAQLQGDVGAREIVDWSSARKLVVDDASVLLDIDTPQDRARWHR